MTLHRLYKSNKIKVNESISCNMVLEIFIMWGCVDLKDCFSAGDLSNIASTYIGIIIGALIGGFISWLIYNRQNKRLLRDCYRFK